MRLVALLDKVKGDGGTAASPAAPETTSTTPTPVDDVTETEKTECEAQKCQCDCDAEANTDKPILATTTAKVAASSTGPTFFGEWPTTIIPGTYMNNSVK